MKNKELTRRAHNAIAKKYYEAYKDDTSDLVFFDEFLNIVKGNILDLGCGMGHYSNYMQQKGYNVTGIDIASEMIKIAQSINPDIEYIVNDICDLSPIKGRMFDGVVLAYVLQHLSKEEVLNIFKELNTNTKHGSKLLIFLREAEEDSIVQEIEPMNKRYKYELNQYSKNGIENLLMANGWEVLKTVQKEPVEDPNSLAPQTLVVFAEKK